MATARILEVVRDRFKVAGIRIDGNYKGVSKSFRIKSITK
jgi:hypothetical protein